MGETVVSASNVPDETHHVKNAVQKIDQPAGMMGGSSTKVPIATLQKSMGTGQSGNDSNKGRR